MSYRTTRAFERQKCPDDACIIFNRCAAPDTCRAPEIDPRDATIARLSAELEAAREALGPFATFAPTVEAFVESRAKAANDASPIMEPTRHFRLSDFRRARTALAKLSATKGV